MLQAFVVRSKEVNFVLTTEAPPPPKRGIQCHGPLGTNSTKPKAVVCTTGAKGALAAQWHWVGNYGSLPSVQGTMVIIAQSRR